MSSENTINFFNELAAIKIKYGKRYYSDQNAIREAAELWGCHSSEHGVCSPIKKEIIVDAGQCRGELFFCETTKSYWLIGVSTTSSYSGGGYAPSVWDSTGYLSYNDARLAGVLKLISFFENVISDKGSCNSTSNRENAKKALRILKAEQTPQMTLF